MQFPVNIGLHRSRVLLFLLLLLHGVAAACVMVLPWAMLWRVVALLTVGVSLFAALRRPRIVGLRLVTKDRLECLLVDGSCVAAKTLPDSTVFARMLVLRLRLGEERRISQLVVFYDQLGADEFRRLRLWLRWQGEPRKDAGATAF